MSGFAIPSRPPTEEPCLCGVVVQTFHTRENGEGEERHRRSMHSAPCGLPCFGAPLEPAVYRSKQFHYPRKQECPICWPSKEPA